MVYLTAWAPKLLVILGILIVVLAVLRYRSRQRKLEQQIRAEWLRHNEWQNGNAPPSDKR